MEREKILVLDDDPKWIKTVEMFLGDAYDLTLTTSAEEAVAHVQTTPFALAILDQRLPNGMTGSRLSIRLRQFQPDLRVIILTGFPELDDAVNSVRSGAVDYLGKERDLATELPLRVEKALAEIRDDKPIAMLLRKGESYDLEFKSSARWDLRQNKVNKDLEMVVVKTISAFLNCDGGVLLLGVDDHGTPIGLEADYKTLKKQDRDGYEAFLTGLFLGVYGNDLSRCIRIDFDDVGGRDVCRIATTPAPRPIFIPDGKGDEHLYIRAGNTTRQLTTRETLEYCGRRW